MKLTKRFAVMAAAVCAFAATLCAPTPSFAEPGNVAAIGDVRYATVKEAVDAAKPGDTITLLQDSTLGGGYADNGEAALVIDKSLTINGEGHVLTCGPNLKRGVRVYGGADVANEVDLVLSNMTVKNPGAGYRCVETRGGHFDLVLDGVRLEGNGYQAQPLTVGGTHKNPASVTLRNNSVIDAGDDAGYGIVTFNPVDLVIDGSSVEGYAALYLKGKVSSEGSAGSKVTVRNGSVLTGNNTYGPGQNDFGVIVTEADDVTVEISDSTVVANATNESAEAVMGFNSVFEEGGRPSVGSKLSISGSSKIDINGDLATFVDPDKAEQNTVEVVSGESTTDAVVPYMVSGRVALRGADGFRVVTPEEAEKAGALSVVEVDGQKVYFTDTEKAEEYADSKKDPNGSIDIVVKPITHTVTFVDKQFGNKVASQVVNAGELAQKPVDLKHDGFVFLGWLSGGKPYDFTVPVMGDIELVASWEKLPEPKPETHTVTVVFGNGQKDLVVEIVDGTLLHKLDDPAREGYEFAGWFLTNTDGVLSDEFDFSTPVTSDFKLYAGWVKKGAPVPQRPSTDDKNEADKKPALPQTGDLSLVAPAFVSAAGIAAVAIGARRRR